MDLYNALENTNSKTITCVYYAPFYIVTNYTIHDYLSSMQYTVVLGTPVEEGFNDSRHNSKQNSYQIKSYILQKEKVHY